MTTKKTYTVHRAMHGDGRDYARGDTREMTESDAAPLVKTGALALEGEVPLERGEPVIHTFGTAPSEVETYTSATGHPVSLLSDQDVSDSRVEGRRSPAKKR